MIVTKRAINQEHWKRTQVRLPPDTHEKLIAYAESNNLSLNSAMLELMEKGLSISSSDANQKQEPSSIQQLQKLVDSVITPQHRELLNKIEDIQKKLPKL